MSKQASVHRWLQRYENIADIPGYIFSTRLSSSFNAFLSWEQLKREKEALQDMTAKDAEVEKKEEEFKKEADDKEQELKKAGNVQESDFVIDSTGGGIEQPHVWTYVLVNYLFNQFLSVQAHFNIWSFFYKPDPFKGPLYGKGYVESKTLLQYFLYSETVFL